MTAFDGFAKRLTQEDGVLVTVLSTRGSVPRKKGAWMAVFQHGIVNTIGGGHLELQALSEARKRLAGATGEAVVRYALGPSLGQCCGGEVHLHFERVNLHDLPRLESQLNVPGAPVALFGGGHVCGALVKVLGTLPLAVHWIDSRDEVFPDDVPGNVLCEHSDPVQAAVASVAPGAQILIMSFSHAEDLEVVAACLLRQRLKGDLPYIGLIGSHTKWATFRHRLSARGFKDEELAQVTCPIGVPGIHGKAPEVIAVAVAAQLLQSLPVQPGD